MQFAVAAHSIDFVFHQFGFGIWPILDMTAVRGISDTELLAIFGLIALLRPSIFKQSIKAHPKDFDGVLLQFQEGSSSEQR